MSVVEKQVIFIMFAMGILGGLGYYIWYRRKRLSCDHTQPLPIDSVEPREEPRPARVNLMADENRQNAERNDVREDEEKLSAKFSLQKSSDHFSQSPVRKKARPRRQLGIYLPPHARDDAATCKQRDSPMANAHHTKMSVNNSDSSLPIPLEKANQPHTPVLPADVKYIISVQIPLWLVSRFIGRQGCSIKSLTQLSGAEFKVPRHPFTESSHTSCNITGSTKQIEAALALISQRFPEVTLPHHSNLKLFHGPRRKPMPKKPQYSVNNQITPAIIPSTQFLASVSHIDSLSSIWLHVNSSDVCPYQVLYEKMNTAYEFASGCSVECSEEDNNEVTKGEYYAVRTSEGFRRGLVKSTDGNTRHIIFLVDCGNHVNVTADRLVPLRCT